MTRNLLQRWHGSAAADFVQLVRARFAAVRVAQVAGSLTYTSLLSLVPLVTVVLTVMSQFSQFARLGVSMRAFLIENLLPDRAGKVIATYAVQFSQKASNLTIVGTALLIVTAVLLLQTVEHTFNNIWDVRRLRPWWLRLPTYWLAITLGPIIFAASVAATSELISVSLGWVDNPRWIGGVVYRLFPVILLAFFFGYLFHTVPNRRLVLWHSAVGGLAAGVGVVVIQRIFGLYLAKLPNFTLIYGAFSVVPIFLIWLYLSWIAVLLGAIVAAVLPDFIERRRVLPDTTGGRVQAALRMAVALVEGQRAGRALAPAQLARRSGQPPTRTEHMLEDMRAAGWVVRTDAGDWSLSMPADRLRLGDIILTLAIGLVPGESKFARLNDVDQRVIDAALIRVQAALDTPIAHLLDAESDGSYV
ncbi:YihY family inner membrane protein [Uliginosibacterium sp. sgz301328]|uniref:YihY family inner membrane protein n=1 Tax=Uliginosibacterium sp. sgz301328 TaxID=3243764 RepID=UPI00359DC33A